MNSSQSPDHIQEIAQILAIAIMRMQKTNLIKVTIMQQSVIKQVLSLQDKSSAELRELWRSIFDTEPPPYSKTYLIPRLAYRLQELAYGVLSEKSAKHLDYLADQIEKGKVLKNNYMSSKLCVGTRLVREFQGNTYHVLVTDKGFTYEGQPYKSLSAIARKITGTRWNGLVFFGLKNSKGM